jgi:PIN domain nuclease of toxin-antitoxin system
MKVLVDIHTFIWSLLNDHRLTPKAKQILRSDEHELVFSLVSLWEIAIKIKTGKLNTIGSSVAYLRDEMNTYGMQLLPIRYEHILQLESPQRPLRPPPHRPGPHRIPAHPHRRPRLRQLRNKVGVVDQHRA